MFATFYSAFMVILIIKYLNVKKTYVKPIEKLGENSFNIFLFQILYFSFGLSILDDIIFMFIDRDKWELLYLICFIVDFIFCYKGSKLLIYLKNVYYSRLLNFKKVVKYND